MILLAMVSNSMLGRSFAMIYGIFSSLALPLETIMLPIYTNDLFGEKSFDKVLGLVVAVNVTGYAVGTPVVNLSFDMLGSYIPALYISGGIMIIVTIGMGFVINAAKKERALVEGKEVNNP